MTTPRLELSIDLPDAEAVIPSGLVCARARFILLVLGFDYIGVNPQMRDHLLFVSQYDSRREETCRHLRISLKAEATVEDVMWALHDAGWYARQEHVNQAKEKLALAEKAAPIHSQIGPLPSQQGCNILAKTMPRCA